MTEKQIREGNIGIAMFMTEEREVLMHDLKKAGTIDSMQYHESWEWLMPVLEKICKTNLELGEEYVEYAYPRTFGMRNVNNGKLMVRLNGNQVFESDSLLEATYMAIVDFLLWYNETHS